MDLSNYIKPADITFTKGCLPMPLTLSKHLTEHHYNSVEYDVALIGIPNDTNGTYNKGSADSVNLIRSELYRLKGGLKNIYLSDLGNIICNSAKDANFALEEVIPYLISKRVIPVIIGGSQDFTYAILKGLNDINKAPNLVCIDQKLDAEDSEDFDHQNYLSHIFNDVKLQSFSLIGHQSYLFDDKYLSKYPAFPHNIIRLGELRKFIHHAEPVLRDADMLSVDMGAVRLSDAPGNMYGSPNGLFGEELCQLTRYAGFSDRIKLFSLFEVNNKCDINQQTSKLAAQSIWHFLDGLDKRYKDYPVRNIESYKKFVVQQSEIDEEIVFYHNPMNNRWWLEIDKHKKIIISCTIDDYQYARANKIPDVYYKWRK